MNLVETPLGFEIQTPVALIFFGKKDSSLENLQKFYPGLSWSKLRQTHSDLVVPMTLAKAQESGVIEGDAQWTEERSLALLTATADCVPLHLIDPRARRVASVHAGWRGVAQRILPKTIQALEKAGSRPQDLWVFTGPHIQKKSFEVGTDVKDLLVQSSSLNEDSAWQAKESKFLVDLNSIVKNQISEFEIPADQLMDLHIDTCLDQNFHSHRRDRERAGRQLSFIFLHP